MIRTLVAVISITLILWAPWMDSDASGSLAEQVFAAFGPMPAACYDSEENLLQEGIEVRWYPLGRMVHTCTGDYIIWFWGAVKESGGVYKRADEIQPVRSRPLTCNEIIERQEGRRATSTDNTVVLYAGTTATTVGYAMFPEAEQYNRTLTDALKNGPNFAGKFVVAEWSCGTNCQNHAVLDVETGQVLGLGPQTEYGTLYAVDSTLLITNPVSALPDIPESRYETEGLALNIARLPREYYRLTTDALSGTQYLVRECIESSATGYIEIEDDRLDIIDAEPSS